MNLIHRKVAGGELTTLIMLNDYNEAICGVIGESGVGHDNRSALKR